MPRTGRPPVPNEIKRRNGNPGKRALPKEGTVVELAPAAGVPDVPEDLGNDGAALWERAWNTAITWLSPLSDTAAVEHACRLADDLAFARQMYRVTGDPKDGRLVASLSKEFANALAALGFDPASRTRLGVAEVTRVSKLQKLREKHGA